MAYRPIYTVGKLIFVYAKLHVIYTCKLSQQETILKFYKILAVSASYVKVNAEP
jgi:hypothetical protein